MKFSETIDRRFELLNPDICQYYGSGSSFPVSEEVEEGYARVQIECAAAPCFHVKQIDKNVFPVLQSKRCADHLIFLFDPRTQSWTLHIFEMTRTISEPNWREKILPQFSGGLTNAYAIMGVLNCADFAEVHVHCCYRRNRSENSSVYLRGSLGEPAPADWLHGPVRLDGFAEKRIQNEPIKLSEEDGTGKFTL